MRTVIALFVVGGLTACGADGEPVQPTMNSTITLSNTGVSASTQVHVTRGRVTYGLGLGL